MKPWQVLSSQVVIDRRPWLHVTEQTVQLPNGHIIEGYLLAQDRDFAMVLALTDDGRAPLVRQYKHGPRRAVFDLPAGYLDEGEDPLACAQRELLEETGYTATDWQHLSSALLNTNRNADRAHLYLARGAVQISAPHLDETEAIATHLYTPDQLAAMVRSGEIESLSTIACVMLALGCVSARTGCFE
jgi:ADP-ribose pyrophosphatase